MSYIVTHGAGGGAGLDFGPGPRGFDLQGALDHARRLILESKIGVAIQDGERHNVQGDDLVACLNGDKELTTDLRVVPK